MNTCEDETEPLGEAPDVPVRYDAGVAGTIEAIQRGAVLGVLAAADKITATAQLAERQAEALSEIRGLATYWRDELSRPPHPPARKQAGQSILAILARRGV